MKKTKILIILPIIFTITSLGCNAKGQEESYDTMRRRIVTYNLINGLYLTEEQANFILNKARGVDSLRKELKYKIEVAEKEQLSLLGELESEVKKDVPQLPSQLAKSIHRNNIYLQRLRRQYIEALDEAAREVKLCLSPVQIYNLKNFKPCLVPPSGGARIGQSEGSKGVIRLLERIRKLPQSRYENKKDTIVKRFIDRVYLKYPRAEEKVSKGAEEVLAIMDEARNLSDIDFALKKKDLAEKIKGLTESDKEIDVDKRIERFLLSSEAIYVLEDKFSSL